MQFWLLFIELGEDRIFYGHYRKNVLTVRFQESHTAVRTWDTKSTQRHTLNSSDFTKLAEYMVSITARTYLLMKASDRYE